MVNEHTKCADTVRFAVAPGETLYRRDVGAESTPLSGDLLQPSSDPAVIGG